MKEIVIKGKITSDGKLKISGKSEMDDFFKENPNRVVFMTIRAIARDKTEPQKGLYWLKIIPDAKAGFEKTGTYMRGKDVDSFLLSECPFINVTSIEDLDREDMSRYIDWCKMYLAENLGVYVPDQRTL